MRTVRHDGRIPYVAGGRRQRHQSAVKQEGDVSDARLDRHRRRHQIGYGRVRCRRGYVYWTRGERLAVAEQRERQDNYHYNREPLQARRRSRCKSNQLPARSIYHTESSPVLPTHAGLRATR